MVIMETKPDVESGWWMYHALFTGLFWGVGPILLFFGMVDIGSMPRIEIISAGILIAYLIITVIAGWGALFGYYYDARAIREVSDWQPWWQFYAIGHILGGAAVVAPLYLLRRGKEVGNDWGEFQHWVSFGLVGAGR